MKNMLQYKGYLGSVEYSAEDHVLYGKIEYIRSLVTFEGTDVNALESAFKDAVEDYLESCNELGLKPEVPFKGSFNVRTGTELHRRASSHATTHQQTLNQVVNEALDKFLEREEPRPPRNDQAG